MRLDNCSLLQKMILKHASTKVGLSEWLRKGTTSKEINKFTSTCLNFLKINLFWILFDHTSYSFIVSLEFEYVSEKTLMK